MIAWLNPGALAGLAFLAGPILIHLLRQHRASRVTFPSVRFVHPSRTAAVRLRSIADPWLLLIRLAALALAICALAGPIVLTPSRLAAWNDRVARAVVVDTSESLRLTGADTAAREAADGEVRSAFASRRIESADVGAAVQQAAAWLASAPPARREVVIVSDFHNGVLTEVKSAGVDATIGRRAVQVGAAAAERRFEGAPRMAGRTDIQIDPSATRVTLTTSPDASAGLRLMTASDAAASADALLRTVAVAGTPAPSSAEPIAVVLAGGKYSLALEPIRVGWMLSAVVRLMSDPDLSAAVASAAPPVDGTPGPWTDIARDAQQRPLVRAAASGSELVIDVAAAPDSFLAAAAVRGVLVARQSPEGYDEQEIARASAGELVEWSREAQPIGREVAVHAERTDARWFWALSLLMLAIETFVRRPNPVARQEPREPKADAA